MTEKFGASAPIVGTLATSMIAMAIAVPIGPGIAFFLTEICPSIRISGDLERIAVLAKGIAKRAIKLIAEGWLIPLFIVRLRNDS